jgi:site-specific recombinase XerD
MTKLTLGPILYSFFEDHLKIQKGLRQTSIKSYRDVIRLYLSFIIKNTSRSITRLCLAELTFESVLRFLKSLEESRRNHIRTRNQRLAVLRTFFEYIALRAPEMLLETERVKAIPIKRVTPSETTFLERDEVELLFSSLPTKGRFALRDYALLLFLYNTGARVQEVADLRARNLELDTQLRVHLHGKGDKWRICPLWAKTASLLKQLLQEEGSTHASDRPVFISRNGQALTRFGIYKIVCHHTQHLLKKKNGTTPLKISPHIFRHTTAVHLLESGVEINVIRAWLGHVSLETTNRYAEITIRMKEEALRACDPSSIISEEFPRRAKWKDDSTLLKWLESL